jgi:hypothetical protein
VDPESAQTALDSVFLVTAAGGALFVLVNIVRMAVTELTPRGAVVTSIIGGLVLVGTYALSNGLLTVANAFDLVLAWITVVAAGAGINSTVNAARTNQPGLTRPGG